MSKRLTNAQKKELAHSYYMSGEFSNIELAKKAFVSAVTIGNWIRDGKWKEIKEAITITSENQLKMFISQLNALNKHIHDRGEGWNFPNSKEADTQIKLTNAIAKFKGKEDLTDTIVFAEGFVRFVQKEHPEKLKEIVLLTNQFVMERA